MMRKNLLLILFATISQLASAQEKILLLNEGIWQTDNGRMTYFEDDHIVSNKWFRDINGTKLGDTPNDIMQINDNLIAIALNWSNIVQFITPEGKAVAATEDVPNNRKLASDGRYVYVTSYGHECGTVNGMKYFSKGFVAKIDISTFKVVAATEVGYEPEGIAFYNGHLFVANTGGYAFQESHEYETTVSILDANTMQVVKTIDTGQINLYGKMSKSGKYLCINSGGDNYSISAATVILDCDKALTGEDDCFVVLPYAATYNCTTRDGNFFAVGSRYSYYTGEYEFNYISINPREVMLTGGAAGVVEDFPGTVLADIKKIGSPYGIYVNPYTGYIYATDSGEFVSGGTLYQWSPEGNFLGKYGVYINPGHFLALPPDGHFTGIENIATDTGNSANTANNAIYDMTGCKANTPIQGNIYIMEGRKILK